MSAQSYPKKVALRDAHSVVIRPLASDDFDKLYRFFQELPPEDRLFLRHNVADTDLIRKWTEQLDLDRVVPLVAEDGDRIVADGTLHIPDAGWMQHVGQIRLVTAKSHRRMGLGTILARELVAVAEERGLEKLQVHVIEDDVRAVDMLRRLGFHTAAVLKELVKDRAGNKRNLAIMINDIPELGRIMEDWIQDSMIPAFRAGEGDG